MTDPLLALELSILETRRQQRRTRDRLRALQAQRDRLVEQHGQPSDESALQAALRTHGRRVGDRWVVPAKALQEALGSSYAGILRLLAAQGRLVRDAGRRTRRVRMGGRAVRCVVVRGQT